MTTIYGLREVDSDEVRYIGRTEHPLHKRLHKHRLNALHGYPPKVSAWINGADGVEIFAISECAKADCNRVERETVERFHDDGHRLTNSHLLPRQTGATA